MPKHNSVLREQAQQINFKSVLPKQNTFKSVLNCQNNSKVFSICWACLWYTFGERNYFIAKIFFLVRPQ